MNVPSAATVWINHLLRNPANARRLINAIARSEAGLDTYHDLIEDD